MISLPTLIPGDTVEIIAPASRSSDDDLGALKQVLESWQLKCLIANNMFGSDLLCANTDESRFLHLKKALINPDTKALICVRGGYGSMRLIPRLSQLNPIPCRKIFVGMSDITALHLFLNQCWDWPTVHAATSVRRLTDESLIALKSILFDRNKPINFTGLIPLNEAARQEGVIEAEMAGGNLTLLQSSIGTSWQLNGCKKIVLFEEIGERAYRVDRMLEQLNQTGILKEAAALVFADFIGSAEPNGNNLILPVIKRFAEQCRMPVVQLKGIGHGSVNYPFPIGTRTYLQLGTEAQLTCFRS